MWMPRICPLVSVMGGANIGHDILIKQEPRTHTTTLPQTPQNKPSNTTWPPQVQTNKNTTEKLESHTVRSIAESSTLPITCKVVLTTREVLIIVNRVILRL
ncbi:hypothetical protein MTP99_013631 [Tenebrio molitor]|nr:hypothetical protein MTP99_013631 [Tenebrio molitor]